MDQEKENKALEKENNLKKTVENSEDNLVKNINKSVQGSETKFVVESVVSNENVENAESNEEFSEDENKKKGDGDIKKRQSDQKKRHQIRANLVKTTRVVTKKTMSRVVKIAIHKEIRQIQKEVRYLSRNTIANAFEISQALKKLKKLKFILKNLAHWASNFLKSLFERVKNKKEIFNISLPENC